jgi:hypothetical protein
MRIVKPIAALCLLALIALHVWLFFPSHDIERAADAGRILFVVAFFTLMAMVISYKRASDPPPPPQWAVNAAGLVFLYAIFWFAVLFIAFKGGSVNKHDGRYYQSKWWGHIRDTEWEVREPQYRRYTTCHNLAFSAFCAGFVLLALTTPNESSEDEDASD